MAKLQTMFSALLLVLFLDPSEAQVMEDAFYKIQSVMDSSVLTATWYGRPRAVITDDWQQHSTQEWKIKAINDNASLKMIRNEAIRDNVVAKQEGPSVAGKNGDFVPIEWNFFPVRNRLNTFALQNGDKCIKNNGNHERITFEDCNPSSTDQQWIVSYLFEL